MHNDPPSYPSWEHTPLRTCRGSFQSLCANIHAYLFHAVQKALLFSFVGKTQFQTEVPRPLPSHQTHKCLRWKTWLSIIPALELVIDEDAAVRGTTFFATSSNMHWICFVLAYKRGDLLVMQAVDLKASSQYICKCAFDGAGNGSRSAQPLQNCFAD